MSQEVGSFSFTDSISMMLRLGKKPKTEVFTLESLVAERKMSFQSEICLTLTQNMFM